MSFAHDEGMTSSARIGLIVAGAIVALAVLGAGALFCMNGLVVASYRPKYVRTPAYQLRRAAEIWRGDHPGEPCPTPQSLRAAGAIDPASALTDPWGSPFRIQCEPDDTIIVSRGPDRLAGTGDDMRFPSPTGGASSNANSTR